MNQNFDPQKVADKINHYLDMFLAKKDINVWKAELSGKVDEYEPGRFFFFPMDNSDFNSFTIWPVESHLAFYSVTIGFDLDPEASATLWSHLKSLWPKHAQDPEVIRPFVINVTHDQCMIKVSFDKDPEKNSEAKLQSVEFEIEDNKN